MLDVVDELAVLEAHRMFDEREVSERGHLPNQCEHQHGRRAPARGTVSVSVDGIQLHGERSQRKNYA